MRYYRMWADGLTLLIVFGVAAGGGFMLAGLIAVVFAELVPEADHDFAQQIIWLLAALGTMPLAMGAAVPALRSRAQADC